MSKPKEHSPTIKDIYDSLERARFNEGKGKGKGKKMLLRPCHAGHTFFETDHSRVKAALDQITSKIWMVKAGLHEFDPCEKLVFEILVEHSKQV